MNLQTLWNYIDNMPDAECAAWVFGLLMIGMLALAIRNEWR